MDRILYTLFILTFSFFAAHGRAWAWPPLYGLELTFSNNWLATATYEDDSVVDHEEAYTYQELMKRRIEAMCGAECTVTKSKDRYGVTQFVVKFVSGEHAGWGFAITQDPGVIEIVTKAATREQWKSMKPLIDKFIFGAAKSAYLEPMRGIGGGHVNIGFESAFNAFPLLFANFFSDMAWHSEIGAGAFDNDFYNAPPIKALQLDRQKRFARIIQDFGETAKANWTIKEAREANIRLANRIEQEVYFGPSLRDGGGGLGGSDPKWHSNNVTSITDNDVPLNQKRWELRGVDTHLSTDEAVNSIELIENRLEYLSQLNSVRRFEPGELPGPKERIENFAQFVRESKLNPIDFANRVTEKRWRQYLGITLCKELQGAQKNPLTLQKNAPAAQRLKNASRRSRSKDYIFQ